MSTPGLAGKRGALLVTAAILFALSAAQAQQFEVIYNFVGYPDGNWPLGVVIDRAGNLYGATLKGGIGNGNCSGYSGCGTVFKLSPQGSWNFTRLYGFTGGDDGVAPMANVIMAPDGTLYGTTAAGGGTDCFGEGCGTVFHLRPQPTICRSVPCPWNESVLHRFDGSDGNYPLGVVLDTAGNLYGATIYGTGNGCGGIGCGTIFQLTPSGNTWTENVVYNFNGSDDGASPAAPTLDAAGNLYGVTGEYGAFQCGSAFELVRSGGSWMFSVLYAFNPGIGDPCQPAAGMIFDPSGKLYGGGLGNGDGAGGVFELSRGQNGTWTESVPYLDGTGFQFAYAPLIRDTAGNLYGTTFSAPDGHGSVFELTPRQGGWTYTTLHVFNCSDGAGPGPGPLAIDAEGNLYGTASYCGTHNAGVVFKITLH